MSRPTSTARGLLDTNVLIDLAVVSEESLPEEPLICAVTLAELGIGPVVARSPKVQAERQMVLQQAESDFDPIPFDAEAARAFARVAASLRQAGRKVSARSFDALIASVALSRGLPLYTANPNDFAHIDGLDVRVVDRSREG